MSQDNITAENGTKVRILLVEDELSIAEPLKFLLEREGYTVTLVGDGRTALDIFAVDMFDLVLLDLMIPNVSGIEVCQEIRNLEAIPIVMLTAKSSEADIVVGLEMGADDYITKPYSSSELLARIRSVLRRSETQKRDQIEGHIVESCGITIDTKRHTVQVRGEDLQLPLREFELLELLMRNTGRVLTREQLIDRLWGDDYFGDTKTLDVHVKRIRNRIEEDPASPKLISTVRGLGYRFN